MNIKQTLSALESAGFAIEQYPRPWRRYEATRKDAEGNGVRVWLFFGKRTKEGRQLLKANTSAFPLMDGERRLLNGAKKRDFEAGREVSRLLSCKVTAIGCSLAEFNNGKLIKK